MTAAPLPPLEVCEGVDRVSRQALAGLPEVFFDALLASSWWDPDRPLISYDRLGAELGDTIRAVLPQAWSWTGKRVLDFGCGAGRVLRHFLPEAQDAEFWGCDRDGRSIEWLQEYLCPPMRAIQCAQSPPLPLQSGSFDLVYSMSVYPPVTENWRAWMVENHRLLAPGGLLLASFLGDSDHGARDNVQSGCWIQHRWGRAFEIVNFAPDGLTLPAGTGPGWALMRRRDTHVTVAELESDGDAPLVR